MDRVFILQKVRAQILNSPKGSVFVIPDFYTYGDSSSISKALSRLSSEGLIRRIINGVYEYPQHSEFLGVTVNPSPEKIAYAIARKHQWEIVPEGNAALNLLGVSTQVPSAWMFASNGPYKVYEIGKVKLKFKHVANKDIVGMSNKTALIVQALKTLGPEHAGNNILSTIIKKLSDKESDDLVSETKQATKWIKEVIVITVNKKRSDPAHGNSEPL